MQNLTISSQPSIINENTIIQNNKAETSLAATFFQSLRNLSLFAYDKCKNKVVEKGEPQLKDVLDAWMESTKVSITIFGKSNVDQILLINTILEETTKKPTSTNTTETLWPEIEKQISAPLLYNDKFPSTINWNKENQSKQDLLNYSKNNNRNTLDLDCGYILPTNIKEFATSPIICYGEVPEIIVTFPKETEIRNALWEYYLVSTGCKRVDDLKKKILSQFHNNIFGNQKKPYGFVSNAKQIPIPNNFTKVIGKTFCFRGKGEDLNIDRIFIREKLREIAKQYGFFTHNVIIKLPSRLVYGKTELVLADIVDNNETKRWKAMNSLKRSNLVILTLDEDGLCDDYYELLYKSGFLEKFLRGEEYTLIVSDLLERSQLSHTNYNLSSTFQKEKFKSELCRYLKKNITSGSDLIDLVEQKLISEVNFLPIKPILYTSIFENSKHIKNEIGTQPYDSLIESSKTTNVPSLVSRCKNMIISQCFLSLKDIHNSWLENNPTQFSNNQSVQSPTKPTESPVEKERTIGEKVNFHKKNLSENIDTWCKQLLEQVSSVQKFLENTVTNCQQKFMQDWGSIKETKLTNIQNCKLFFKSDEYGRNKEIDFNSIFFSFIITEVPVLWNNLFGNIVLCVQSLYQLCANSYQYYISIITKNKNSDRIEGLVKILQGSTERFLKENITQIDWIIGEKNVKDTVFYWCNKLLCEKIFTPSSSFDSLLQYHSLVEQNIPGLPNEVARNIHQEFTQLIEKVINHLRKIESQILRDIEKCNSLAEINKDNFPNFSSSVSSSLVVNNSQNLMNNSNESNLLRRLFDKAEWKGLKTQNNENSTRSSFKLFNLFSISVSNDHTSQFRAISHQIYGTEEAYGLVRLITLNELLSNTSRYANFINKDQKPNLDVSETVQQFVSKFNNGAVQFGDHLTLLACVNAYNWTFHIHSPFSTSPIILKPQFNQNPSKKTGHISVVGYNTYQSLVPFESLNVDDMLLNPEFVKTPVMDRKKRKSRNNNQRKPSETNFVYQDNKNNMDLTENNVNSITKKRNLSDESEYEIKRIEKRIKSEKSFIQTRKVPTLKNMCIDLVSQYSSLMPSLEGCLPNELLQRIISLLIKKKSFDAKNLSNFISSSMNSIDLSNSDQVDESYCQIISKRCSHLANISFENCKNITDKGLQYIASCSPHLKHINLAGCAQIGDLGLQELAKRCPELVSINLEGCKKITDCSLQNLSLSCKRLSVCNVSNCVELTDDAFRFVGNTLEVIEFSNCPKLGDPSLYYILKNNQQNIKKIKISGSTFTDKSVEYILYCKNLVCLEMNESPFSDNAINSLLQLPLQKLSLPSCKNIKESSFQHLIKEDKDDFQNPSIKSSFYENQLCDLDLSFSLNFNDRALQIISVKCNNLRFLSLKSCEELSDGGVAMLSKCRNLEHLDLSSLKITDDSISSISLNCLKLTKLILTNCRNVTDISMKYIGDNLLKISHLDLCFCHKITDEGLSAIATGCKEMEVIGLEDLIITDNSIILFAGCPNLRVLNLAYCKMISDFSLYKLAESCANVEQIDLSYCVGITISSVQNAMSKWENLSTLSIRGNDLLTTQAISHPRLRNLDISWSKFLTDEALILSSRNCPMLSCLDLTWCIKLTDNSVKNISTFCPSIREIKLRGCTSVSFSTIKYLINIGTVCHR